MSEELMKTKRGEFKKVDPRLLKEAEGFNVREDLGDIEGLAQSIKAKGVQKSLKARTTEDGYLQVIDGHRRLAAIKKVLEEGGTVGYVPVEMAGRYSSEEDDIKDLVIQNDGKALSTLEQGYAFKRLIDKGYSVKEIAEEMGRSQPQVNNAVRLASAPKEVRNEIAKGKIASTEVLKLLREVKDEEEQVKKVKEAVKEVDGDEKEEESKEKASSSSGTSSSKKGKKGKKAAKVKDLKAGDSLQRLKEVRDELKERGAEGKAMETIEALVSGLESKKSASEIADAFKAKKEASSEKSSSKKEEDGGKTKREQKGYFDPDKDKKEGGGLI